MLLAVAWRARSIHFGLATERPGQEKAGQDSQAKSETGCLVGFCFDQSVCTLGAGASTLSHVVYSDSQQLLSISDNRLDIFQKPLEVDAMFVPGLLMHRNVGFRPQGCA